MREHGETFKFISHSQGDAFAGMGSYLQLQGQKVESMLFLSPHQSDDIPKVLGTFSIQATFGNDKFGLGSTKPIDGVNINMVFNTLGGQNIGSGEAHGATVNSLTIKKIQDVLDKFGPYLNFSKIPGKWAVTEDQKGNLKFTRLDQNNQIRRWRVINVKASC